MPRLHAPRVLTVSIAAILLIGLCSGDALAQAEQDPTRTLLSAVSSSAQTTAQIAECAAVANDIGRLQCYDALAASIGTAPDASVSSDSNWIVNDKTNPIDDTRTVALLLRSASGTSRGGQPIGLILRCQSGDTTVFINWSDYLGSEANVLTRVGTDEAATRRWSLSTDSQATFAPGNNIEFIQRLLGADRLVAQVTPYSESPVTAIFDLTGIETALAPLREACGW